MTNKMIYAGVDMTNWDFRFDENDEKFIYKAFVSLCNYAEEFIPCGDCPLYGMVCFSKNDAGQKFWDKVRRELDGVEL